MSRPVFVSRAESELRPFVPESQLQQCPSDVRQHARRQHGKTTRRQPTGYGTRRREHMKALPLGCCRSTGSMQTGEWDSLLRIHRHTYRCTNNKLTSAHTPTADPQGAILVNMVPVWITHQTKRPSGLADGLQRAQLCTPEDVSIGCSFVQVQRGVSQEQLPEIPMEVTAPQKKGPTCPTWLLLGAGTDLCLCGEGNVVYFPRQKKKEEKKGVGWVQRLWQLRISTPHSERSYLQSELLPLSGGVGTSFPFWVTLI